jgi:hypothetical protein
LAKLFNFNIMVDAVVREMFWILREESDLEGEELDKMMDALFAFFLCRRCVSSGTGPRLLTMGNRRSC